jgi:hypothetical protein
MGLHQEEQTSGRKEKDADQCGRCPQSCLWRQEASYHVRDDETRFWACEIAARFRQPIRCDEACLEELPPLSAEFQPGAPWRTGAARATRPGITPFASGGLLVSFVSVWGSAHETEKTYVILRCTDVHKFPFLESPLLGRLLISLVFNTLQLR